MLKGPTFEEGENPFMPNVKSWRIVDHASTFRKREDLYFFLLQLDSRNWCAPCIKLWRFCLRRKSGPDYESNAAARKGSWPPKKFYQALFWQMARIFFKKIFLFISLSFGKSADDDAVVVLPKYLSVSTFEYRNEGGGREHLHTRLHIFSCFGAEGPFCQQANISNP